MEPDSVYNCVRKRDHNNCGQKILFVCLFVCLSPLDVLLFVLFATFGYDSYQST